MGIIEGKYFATKALRHEEYADTNIRVSCLWDFVAKRIYLHTSYASERILQHGKTKGACRELGRGASAPVQ